MKRFASLILLAALLFAQGALLAHEYDFAIHQHGDDCSTCLHATPLSNAVSGTAMIVVPVVTVHSEFYPLNIAIAPSITISPSARAPPVVSSV